MKDVKHGTNRSWIPLGIRFLELYFHRDDALLWYTIANLASISRWMADAGALVWSLSKAGLFPFSSEMARYCTPIATSSGMLRASFRAGRKVSEFMLLHDYINQPMHVDLAAWHGRGWLRIDILCLEREMGPSNSVPNLASGT